MNAEATAAYFAAAPDGGFDHQRDAYEQGWEDGVVALREKLAAVISAEKIRTLANWFDEDDAVKMMLRAEDPTLPSTWEKRGDGLQSDLRKFADLLDGRDA